MISRTYSYVILQLNDKILFDAMSNFIDSFIEIDTF